MKTNEFIDKVEDMEYIVIERDEELWVRTYDNDIDIATISKRYEMILDTNYNLKIERPLLELIFEYTMTPIEDRKDEPAYRVIIPDTSDIRKHTWLTCSGAIGYTDHLSDIEYLTEERIREINPKFMVFAELVEE